MQTDGRTVMTKLIVAFRNFAKAPKNCTRITYLGTSLPCPQEPVLSQTHPAHVITRLPFKVCLYHSHIYVFVSLGTVTQGPCAKSVWLC